MPRYRSLQEEIERQCSRKYARGTAKWLACVMNKVLMAQMQGIDIDIRSKPGRQRWQPAPMLLWRRSPVKGQAKHTGQQVEESVPVHGGEEVEEEA